MRERNSTLKKSGGGRDGKKRPILHLNILP
jgi:hypothetical protein